MIAPAVIAISSVYARGNFACCATTAMAHLPHRRQIRYLPRPRFSVPLLCFSTTHATPRKVASRRIPRHWLASRVPRISVPPVARTADARRRRGSWRKGPMAESCSCVNLCLPRTTGRGRPRARFDVIGPRTDHNRGKWNRGGTRTAGEAATRSRSASSLGSPARGFATAKWKRTAPGESVECRIKVRPPFGPPRPRSPGG